jgi:hypothetical protein
MDLRRILRVYFSICVKVLRKSMKLLSIAAAPAVIRTEYMPNTNQKSYHSIHIAV